MHVGIMFANRLSIKKHLRLVFSKINKNLRSVTQTSMTHAKISTSYYI